MVHPQNRRQAQDEDDGDANAEVYVLEPEIGIYLCPQRLELDGLLVLPVYQAVDRLDSARAFEQAVLDVLQLIHGFSL